MGNVRNCIHGRLDGNGECSCDSYFTGLKEDYANYQECYDCDDYEELEDCEEGEW